MTENQTRHGDEPPRIRRIRGVGAMTEGAFWVFLALAFALVVVLVIASWAWRDAQRAETRLDAEQIARATERVGSCVNSIGAIRIANLVVDSIRGDYEFRAKQAEKLAVADPTERLRRAHRANADAIRAKAKLLVAFPSRTQEECDRLADKLDVPHQTARPLTAGPLSRP